MRLVRPTAKAISLKEEKEKKKEEKKISRVSSLCVSRKAKRKGVCASVRRGDHPATILLRTSRKGLLMDTSVVLLMEVYHHLFSVLS